MDKEQVIFLDTETTGIGQRDRLIQVAYWFQGKEYEALFKPPVEISIEAMTVSHITNEMVADAEEFTGSHMQQHLSEIFAAGGILVAHNATFDQGMLEREGMDDIKHVIDTCKVARALDTEMEVPRYGLQYLRYFFKLDKNLLEGQEIVAHDALGDVRILKVLFDKQFNDMLEVLESPEAVLAEMIAITERPVLHRTMPFGKYKGEKIQDLAEKDAGYLNWLLMTKKKALEENGEDDEGWITTIEHYLQ